MITITERILTTSGEVIAYQNYNTFDQVKAEEIIQAVRVRNRAMGMVENLHYDIQQAS